MNKFFHGLKNVGVLVVIILIAACSRNEKKTAEPITLTHEVEKEYSKQLSTALEKKFGKWKDPVVEGLLKSVSTKVVASDTKLTGLNNGLQFVILNSQTPFAVPGINKIIYISKGALALVEYENELAFLVTTPILMIQKKLPEKRFESLINEENSNNPFVLPIQPSITRVDFLNSGWFDNGGFFDFGVNEYIEADKDAVAIPPKAKFDHRGGLSLFQRFAQDPVLSKVKSLIKYSPDIIERYENIKVETAKILPIRDAILKSRAMRDYKSRFKESG